ncbi:MAG: hypothetical protein GX767_01590 [Firmicutes bacterium]|nr:hypothetical protein [Bacillota bacterium]
MGKNWRDVKEALEKEIDKIWFEEPLEVTMSKHGVFPSGAGTKGKYFGNLLFLVADTQAMGWWTIEPAMYAALDDELFTLEHCKRMFKYLTVHMAKLMGAELPPNCPGPWLNLPKVWSFCQDIVDSFETITTKEDLKDLIWSWENYINRLNRWFYLVFPWELGNTMDRVEEGHLEYLKGLLTRSADSNTSAD